MQVAVSRLIGYSEHAQWLAATSTKFDKTQNLSTFLDVSYTLKRCHCFNVLRVLINLYYPSRHGLKWNLSVFNLYWDLNLYFRYKKRLNFHLKNVSSNNCSGSFRSRISGISSIWKWIFSWFSANFGLGKILFPG